jgi:hypothetical protein
MTPEINRNYVKNDEIRTENILTLHYKVLLRKSMRLAKISLFCPRHVKVIDLLVAE